MISNHLPRYEITIAIGLRKQYGCYQHSYEYLEQICQEFVDIEKTCVTVTPTKFIYVDGNEPGAYVRLINYPRFPSTDFDVYILSEKLVYILMDKLDQERCSLMTPSDIVLYENPKYKEDQ